MEHETLGKTLSLRIKQPCTLHHNDIQLFLAVFLTDFSEAEGRVSVLLLIVGLSVQTLVSFHQRFLHNFVHVTQTLSLKFYFRASSPL